MCPMSNVTCHVSYVPFLTKLWCFLGEGPLSTGPTLSSLYLSIVSTLREYTYFHSLHIFAPSVFPPPPPKKNIFIGFHKIHFIGTVGICLVSDTIVLLSAHVKRFIGLPFKGCTYNMSNHTMSDVSNVTCKQYIYIHIYVYILGLFRLDPVAR